MLTVPGSRPVRDAQGVYRGGRSGGGDTCETKRIGMAPGGGIIPSGGGRHVAVPAIGSWSTSARLPGADGSSSPGGPGIATTLGSSCGWE